MLARFPDGGISTFLAHVPTGMPFFGVDLDTPSRRGARVLYPDHDIRLEHFRDTCLSEDCLGVVLGNVLLADLRLD